MRLLLTIRDSLGRFYGKYDSYIRLLFKWMLALVTFCAINTGLGWMTPLKNPILIFGLSVVCAFLPANSIVLVGTGMILAHFYGLSTEAAIVGGGMLAVGMMLYFGIAPYSSVSLLVTALSLAVGFPCVSAVMFGLIGGPLSAVGAVFGTFVFYLIRIIGANGGNLQSTASTPAEALVEKSILLIDEVIKNKEMILMMLVLAVTLWLVWVIRRMAVKYAWMVAAAAGILVYLMISLTGASSAGMQVRLPAMIADVSAAAAAALLSQTMLFNLDYQKTENIRFEDDEYYYYVKAIPKRRLRRKRRSRRADRR